MYYHGSPRNYQSTQTRIPTIIIKVNKQGCQLTIHGCQLLIKRIVDFYFFQKIQTEMPNNIFKAQKYEYQYE